MCYQEIFSIKYALKFALYNDIVQKFEFILKYSNIVNWSRYLGLGDYEM